MLLFVFLRGGFSIHCHSADEEGVPAPSKPFMSRSASRLTGQNVRGLTLPLYDFDLRASHARTLLPAALASVSFGFVLVRVRVRLRGRTIGALRAERHTLTSVEWTSCSTCHELLCSRAFLFIVLRSAQYPQIPRFLQIFRVIWPMPLSLLNIPRIQFRLANSTSELACTSTSMGRWTPAGPLGLERQIFMTQKQNTTLLGYRTRSSGNRTSCCHRETSDLRRDS